MANSIIDDYIEEINNKFYLLVTHSEKSFYKGAFDLLNETEIKKRYENYKEENKFHENPFTYQEFKLHIYHNAIKAINKNGNHEQLIYFLHVNRDYLPQFTEIVASLDLQKKGLAENDYVDFIHIIMPILLQNTHNAEKDLKNKIILNNLFNALSIQSLFRYILIEDELDEENIANKLELKKPTKWIHPNDENDLDDNQNYHFIPRTITLDTAVKRHLKGFDLAAANAVLNSVVKNRVKEKFNVVFKDNNNRYDENNIRAFKSDPQVSTDDFNIAIHEFFKESILNNLSDDLNAKSNDSFNKKIAFVNKIDQSKITLEPKLKAVVEIVLHLNDLHNRKYTSNGIQKAKESTLLDLTHQLMNAEKGDNVKDIIKNWKNSNSTVRRDDDGSKYLTNSELLSKHRRDFAGAKFNILKSLFKFFDSFGTTKSKKFVNKLKQRNKPPR